MTTNLAIFFKYLKNENINIDQSEFVFQFESHPDYPSLLAISDTLSFFNVQNDALKIKFSEINQLPNVFIALLNTKEQGSYFSLILKRGEDFNFINKSSDKLITISKNELESKWAGIVFLVEGDKKEIPKSKKSTDSLIPILWLILFSSIIFKLTSNLPYALFLIFPLIGTILSIAALKDLFGTTSKLLNNFCHITTTSSCEAVVSSTKWRIFKILNLSDLSITFFATQFFALLLLSLSGRTNEYFTIQKILLFLSVPVISLSIYYQKYVEKRWCPICLLIVSLIIIELLYVLFLINHTIALSTFGILLFSFVYISSVSIWYFLKKKFLIQKELREFRIKSIRFQRNYKLFKNILLSGKKYNLPNNLFLGNKNSHLQITIITSVFCNYCQEAYKIISKIYEKYGEDVLISISFLFNSTIENQKEESKILYRNLVRIYQESGGDSFHNALKLWYKDKNFKQWIATYNSKEIDIKKTDPILNINSSWCKENKLTFTPNFFIQGYQYPEMYNRKELLFFMNELIEDNL